MSPQSVAVFVGGFAITALLLLNLLFCTRWQLWVKALAVAVVAALFHSTWQSMPSLLGWPTRHGLPERFNLMALEVKEPDKSGQDKGGIYLWITALNLDNSPRTPRAFVVPFHPELQAKLAAAGTKLRKNMPQVGERTQEPFESSGDSPGHEQALVNLDFYDLPDPLFPEETPPR